MASNDSFTLPEGLNNNELADMANSYFVWESMNALGLAQTLFPEEDLGESRLPSGRFINFVNHFLSTFHLSFSGRILSSEELMRIDAVLASLRTPETPEGVILNRYSPGSHESYEQECHYRH